MTQLVPLDKPYQRSLFTKEYIANMTEYLRCMHPEAPIEVINEFVKQRVNMRCQLLLNNLMTAKKNHDKLDVPRTGNDALWPTAQVIYSADPNDPTHKHSYGNYTVENAESLTGLANRYANKVITPSGTFYETTDKGKSFIGTMVNNKKKSRSAEKKLMLAAKNCNDRIAERFHNTRQASIKIKMNSLPGAFGANGNLYTSIPNYNAITSTARFCIQTAYAHAERFLESNFYFRNSEQVINFIVTCNRNGPDPSATLDIVKQYNLYQPTVDDVYQFLITSLKRYTFDRDFGDIRTLLEHCSDGQLAFLFYMSNMCHIVRYNEEYFRPWIDELMQDENVVLNGVNLDEIDPNDLYKLDSDLVIMLSTFYNHLMPLNPKSGNTITPYDTLSSEYNRPDIARKIVVLGHHAEAKLAELDPLFDHFTFHNVGIGYVSEHKNMFRDATILSDTDSIIFTTGSWVKWFQHGKIEMNHKAFNMNALAVYWLSKANANILYYLSKVLGAVGKEMMILNMKNEFMMPVEISTSRKKNYASVLKIQEGVFYNQMKLDVKGVGFRGSTLPKITLDYSEQMIRDIIEDTYSNLGIDPVKYIAEVLKFERLIYDNLLDGHTKFLPITSVREKSEYKNDDINATVYFNYLLWEEVFAEDYGHILLPTKCYTLPCNNKDIRSKEYLDYLSSHNPQLCGRLKQFLDKFPKKDINRIIVNPQISTIPVELRKIIDYKAIIHNNCGPVCLLLQSFGINTGTPRKDDTSIFSDIYGFMSKGSKPDSVNLDAE